MTAPPSAPPRTPGRTPRRLRRYPLRGPRPADVIRRYQVLPPQGFCTGCGWRDKGTGDVTRTEAEALGHHLASGHQTRVATVQQAIYALPEDVAEVGAGG